MPRSRSRSRSPYRRDGGRRSPSPSSRRRSRSRDSYRDAPRSRRGGDDEPRRPRRPDAGFRWKDKRRDDERDYGGDKRRLERGYRERRRSRSPPREKPPQNSAPPQTKQPAAPSAPSGGGEPMIIVNVNDRLGTKAAIPCLASDPVGMPSLCRNSLLQTGQRPACGRGG